MSMSSTWTYPAVVTLEPEQVYSSILVAGRDDTEIEVVSRQDGRYVWQFESKPKCSLFRAVALGRISVLARPW